MKTLARINLNSGIGGFLDAPGFPTHTASVETAHLNRLGGLHCWSDGGATSIDAAVDDESLPGWVRRAAARLIEEWRENRPALESEIVQAWIAHCLGYFRGCYRGKDAGKFGRGEWAAESLTIDQERDPLATPEEHAAVHLIHKFYPEYVLTREDLSRAHWGDHARVGCQQPQAF